MRVRLFTKLFVIDNRYIAKVKDNHLFVYNIDDFSRFFRSSPAYIFTKKNVFNVESIQILTVYKRDSGYIIGCCYIPNWQINYIQKQFKYTIIFK
jgi:intein/homing endonuclease